MATQNQIVLGHMRMYGGISSFTAFEKYGITRLAARIHDLRDQGHVIETHNVTRKNRHNNPVTFALYTLEETKTSNE